MEFQEQPLGILRTDGNRVEMPVIVGVGSGLGYHRQSNDPKNDFILCHVGSGIDIASDWYADEEMDARLWLEKVAKLLNWTQDLRAVKRKSLRIGIDALRGMITQALREAHAEIDAGLLKYPEPIEDGVPANWPDEPLSMKTIRE